MRKVSANVYKFDELPLSVQTKVVDRYRDELSDLLADDLKEVMNMELNKHTHNLDFELAYSLDCCQGDGVSFTGSVEGKEELFALAAAIYGDKIPINISRLIKWNIIYKVDFIRSNSYYVHKNTVTTILVENYETEKNYCHITRAMTEFENDINEWYSQTCDILEKEGYKAIDNLCSDDNIKSYITENSLEFFLDGSDYIC